MQIGNYEFNEPLLPKNAGFSKWGIGRYNEREFFVKEFLSPKYPADGSLYKEAEKQKRINICENFIKEKKKLYAAVREASDNHLVVVEQFFREGAKFYISTEAITSPTLSISDISSRPFVDRLRLCCIVAHAIKGLHKCQIVHADIKPDNILVYENISHCLTAKIIDFDCSFFEYAPPGLKEELNGDLVYLSPEGSQHIAGVVSNLSCKMDVFALGILFHQYLTGEFPGFDAKKYQYACESVLHDIPLDVSSINNSDCQGLISSMLLKSPSARPGIDAVFTELNRLLLIELGRKKGDPPQVNPWFEVAGDL